MKKWLLAATAILMTGTAVQAQAVVIDSLDSTGKLTATVPSNAVYSIEWTGALSPSNTWENGWWQHRDVLSEDGVVEAEVPMAFRLTCWTNGLFVNAPVGRTYYYSVTNSAAIPQGWERHVQVMGDTYMPLQTNNYRTIWTEEWYSSPTNIPAGAQGRGVSFMRSDENNVYVLDSEFEPGPMMEDPLWKNAPTGTIWSYQASTPHTLITSEILAIEDVVIGSTTYEDCIKIESVGAFEPWLYEYPERRYIDWVQPGGYVVKSMNWWVHEDYTNATPVIYELQSWTDI